MPNLVIQPGAGRREHRLCFSGNKPTLPSGDCHESFLSKTPQPGLTADYFVFHLRVRQRLLQCMLQVTDKRLPYSWQTVSFPPKVRRRLEAVRSQFVQFLLTFGEVDRTSALAQ